MPWMSPFGHTIANCPNNRQRQQPVAQVHNLEGDQHFENDWVNDSTYASPSHDADTNHAAS